MLALARLVFGVVLVSTSAVLSALFGYTAWALARYTPVYSPIRCISLASEISGLKPDGGSITGTGVAKKACRNPNPYPMHMVQAGNESAGQVFIKESTGLKPLGVSLVPEIAFAPRGPANLTALLELSVPLWDAFYLLTVDKLQIVAEFRVLAKAKMEFLGLEFWIAEEQYQVCGFEARMLSMQIGGVACASSIDELVIQEASDTSVVEDTFDMTPERYDVETRRKNTIFGSILAVSAVLAMASGICGARLLRPALRGGPSVESQARDMKVREPQSAPQDEVLAEIVEEGREQMQKTEL